MRFDKRLAATFGPGYNSRMVEPAIAAFRPAAVPAWQIAAPGLSGLAYDVAGKRLLATFAEPGRIAEYRPDGSEANPVWADWPGANVLRAGPGILAVAGALGIAAFELSSRRLLWQCATPFPATAVVVDASNNIIIADENTGLLFQCGVDGLQALPAPPFARPAGLHALANLLFVAEEGSAEQPGRVLAFNRKSGAVQPVTPRPAGQLLGLDRDDKCYYITLDAAAGNILRISPVGEVNIMLTGCRGAGVPVVLADRRILVLPHAAGAAAFELDSLKR
jgi:hypothetical protein